MTKPRALKTLRNKSYVQTLCMAMFRAGVTETSYPAHPGMTTVELAMLAQLTTKSVSKSLSRMVLTGRAVITTPMKQTYRRYVLSAAQVVQCVQILSGQVPQRSKLKLSLFEKQIVETLSGGRQLTSGEIIALLRDSGRSTGAIYGSLTHMWNCGKLQRSGVPGGYTYSLPTQPAEPLTPTPIESQIVEALSGGQKFTSSEIMALLDLRGLKKNSVFTQLRRMWDSGKLQRSGVPGYYAYSLPTQPAEHTEPTEHTEPAETAELSNSDHTDSSIVQATIDAFHQAGEPLSDEQIEALHHMHPDRHQALRDGVAAKALAKVRQEREAREARETALFEEYLQAAVEADQMELLDT